MTILIDTGVLVAWLNTADGRHDQGRALMARILGGEFGVPIIIDHVIDETLTLLMSRKAPVDVSQALAAELFARQLPRWQLRQTTLDDLQEAVEIHLKHHERGLSITDCALILHTTQLRATLATFDSGFKGIVALTS